MNLVNENRSIGNDVYPWVIISEIARPMAGPSNIPFLPAPVAIYNPFQSGTLPIIGKLSGAIGRKHAV